MIAANPRFETSVIPRAAPDDSYINAGVTLCVVFFRGEVAIWWANLEEITPCVVVFAASGPPGGQILRGGVTGIKL